MVTPDVTLQAHVVIEAFVTMLTLIGPLPCVQTHVGFQVARLVEATLAHRTLKRLHPRVHSQVSLEVSRGAKVNPADVTFELRGASVVLQVGSAFLVRGEPL